jgi:hypothetical protein
MERRTAAANNVVPINLFPDDLLLVNGSLIGSSCHPAALRQTNKKGRQEGLRDNYRNEQQSVLLR